MDIKETLATKKTPAKEVTYTSDYRILASNAQAIPKDGNTFKPENDDHIKVLEEQVIRGYVTKE